MNRLHNKIAKFGKKIWKTLPNEAKESYYYDTGIVGYVENLLDLFKMMPTHEECEEIYFRIFGGDTKCRYKYMNDYTGELRKNLWDVTTYLIWYFFYCIRNHHKNPVMPGKWKYNRKGW